MPSEVDDSAFHQIRPRVNFNVYFNGSVRGGASNIDFLFLSSKLFSIINSFELTYSYRHIYNHLATTNNQ